MITHAKYRESQKKGSVSALRHIRSCKSVLESAIINISQVFLHEYLSPSHDLQNNISLLIQDVLKDNRCEECAVAVVQISKSIFERGPQTVPMRMAKDNLSRCSLLRIDLPNRTQAPTSVLFRTCLLASQQHKTLFWNYVRAYWKSLKPSLIVVEFSLENDYLYWSDGIPPHRMKEVISICRKLIPEVSPTEPLQLGHSTRLELTFSGKSRPLTVNSFDIVFRLEDSHPFLDIAVDSLLHKKLSPVVTMTCRGMIESGRDSHLTLTRRKATSSSQYHFLPPVVRDDIREFEYHRHNVPTAHRKAVRLVSMYGQKRLKTAFENLTREDFHWINLILDLDLVESWMLVGADNCDELTRVLTSRFGGKPLEKFSVIERTPIESFLDQADLYVALAIDGAGATVRRFVDLGIPIFFTSSGNDVPLQFPESIQQISATFGTPGFQSLYNFLCSSDSINSIAEIYELERNELIRQISEPFVTSHMLEIVSCAKENFDNCS